jgi:hypothetical protein
MRIDTKSTIAGFPAIQIRDLLRFGKRGVWFFARGAADLLKIGDEEADTLLDRLARDGYVTRPTDRNLRERDAWQVTDKGSRLAMASAGKPVRRATADKAIKEFLERVKTVKENPEFLFKVAQVIIFGSYLDASRESVGDVDVWIQLRPRYKNEVRQRKAVAEQVQSEGIVIGRNMLEQHGWPMLKVSKFLTHGSRVIQISTDEGDSIRKWDHQVIYEDLGVWPTHILSS